MFTDPDPIEEDLGLRVEFATPDQLVAYLKRYQEVMNGVRVAVQGMPERQVFAALQRAYGTADAGRIVKWVCYQHRGRYRDELVVPSSFSKGRRWFTDRMHMEYQDHLRSAAPVTATSPGLGTARLSGL